MDGADLHLDDCNYTITVAYNSNINAARRTEPVEGEAQGQQTVDGTDFANIP